MKKIFQMKMLSILFSTFLICIFLIIEAEAVTAAVQRDDSSQMIYYGEPVFIQIDPSKLEYIESPQDIGQLQLLVYSHLLDEPEMIDMKKRNGIWEAVYTLTDTGVKMLMFTVQVEASVTQEIFRHLVFHGSVVRTQMTAVENEIEYEKEKEQRTR